MKRSKQLYILLSVLAVVGVVTFAVTRYEEKQEQIRQILIEQLQPLSDGIIDASSNILSLTANDTDVVFVLGGGSIPMLKQSNLRRDLVELLQSLGSEAPVIGVDSKFAQWMNEIGLLIALSVMVQEAKDSGVIE